MGHKLSTDQAVVEEASHILIIEWPDEPGEDEREFTSLAAAEYYIRECITLAPWTGPRPSWELYDAYGQMIQEG